MKYYLGVTDINWYNYLSRQDRDDVNFWQPGGNLAFRVLSAGQPLLYLIKQNPSFSLLDEYEKHLPARFGDDINHLYLEEVNTLLTKNTGRKFYEMACRYLRKIKKRGARELVGKKIEEWRHQYSQRRALLEELDQV